MKDKLAIIVPFRDRQDHLDIFVPHMHEFLKDKGIDYTIFIAEQTDDRPFNYGKLCNVVTKEIGEEYTYFAFHDIDMLPINDDCDYSYPDDPIHLATKVQAHNNELPYPQYFGGVILINRDDFEAANGYSNEYWGYGFEDLDLLRRIQKSGGYLEKFYDLNKVYSNYDDTDILPYRIENVDLSVSDKKHQLKAVKLNNDSYCFWRISSGLRKTIEGSFSLSLWFKDDSKITDFKKIFALLGMDSGLFLSNGKYLITQIWDNNRNHYEVSQDYYRDRWNHVVMTVDLQKHKLGLHLNKKYKEITIPSDFKLHREYGDINLSEIGSSINLANILIFDKPLKQNHINELYYNGNDSLEYFESNYGLVPSTYFDFGNQLEDFSWPSHYEKRLVLDKGKNHNHLKIEGDVKTFEEIISLTDVVYIPIRMEGKYKSLVHENDTNIIDRYYDYDPDIEENADIFFHEVLTDELDYTQIGLNSLNYESVKEKNEELNYISFKIVT